MYNRYYIKEIILSDFDDRYPSEPMIVEFSVTVYPSEPDVGIFSAWLEDFVIEDVHLPTLPNGLGEIHSRNQHYKLNKYIEEYFEDEVIQDFEDEG